MYRVYVWVTIASWAVAPAFKLKLHPLLLSEYICICNAMSEYIYICNANMINLQVVLVGDHCQTGPSPCLQSHLIPLYNILISEPSHYIFRLCWLATTASWAL